MLWMGFLLFPLLVRVPLSVLFRAPLSARLALSSTFLLFARLYHWDIAELYRQGASGVWSFPQFFFPPLLSIIHGHGTANGDGEHLFTDSLQKLAGTSDRRHTS